MVFTRGRSPRPSQDWGQSSASTPTNATATTSTINSTAASAPPVNDTTASAPQVNIATTPAPPAINTVTTIRVKEFIPAPASVWARVAAAAPGGIMYTDRVRIPEPLPDPNPHTGRYHSLDISFEQLNGPGWRTSPISQAVGIPLKLARFDSAKATRATVIVVAQEPNSLLVDIDPVSPNFGSGPSLKGHIMIAREDGEPLEMRYFDPLLAFMDGKIKWTLDQHTKPDALNKSQALALMPYLTNPYAFMRFWDDFRGQVVMNHSDPAVRQFWQEMECPIQPPHMAVTCQREGYGKMESLRKREDCGAVSYCSERCREKDQQDRHFLICGVLK